MTPPPPPDDRREIVRRLANSIRQVETAAQLDQRELEAAETLSLSQPAREHSLFERLLPGGRLPAGGLLEVLAEGAGSGGAWLTLYLASGRNVACGERLTVDTGASAASGKLVVAETMTSGKGSVDFNPHYLSSTVPPHHAPHGAVVLIDAEHELYPPALAGLGLDLSQTIVVRPRTQSEGTWAFEQALRCPGVAAVWCRNQKWNDRVFRRLQLAAEAGGGVGLVSSPAAARKQPSWAEVRWLVRPVARRPQHGLSQSPGRRLQIELLSARWGTGGGVVELEICDETGAVRLVSPVAAATTVA